jgi:hypothetical protein
MENPLKNLLETEEEIKTKQKEFDSKFKEGTFSDDELSKIEKERDSLKKDNIHEEALIVNSLIKNKEDVDTAIEIVDEEIVKAKKQNKKSSDLEKADNTKADISLEKKDDKVQNEIKPVEELKGLKLKKQLDNLEKDKEKQKRIKKLSMTKLLLKI